MKYRHKKTVVDALVWQGSNIKEILHFCGENRAKVQGLEGNKSLYILTIDGNRFVDYGDYVIKDSKNRLFEVNKNVFKDCYEVMEEK